MPSTVLASVDEIQVVVIDRQVAVSTEAPGEVFVVAAGQIGPRGSDGNSPADIELEAGETMTAGTPVYALTNKLYAASNLNNYPVIGVLRTSVNSGFTGVVSSTGEVAMTGLTPGAKYFLGEGVLTSTPPTAGILQEIGVAVSSTRLIVGLRLPILLV